MSFPWKLFEMLEDAEQEKFDDIVSWLPDGSGLKVHKQSDFSEKIMKEYFKQSKFKSFTRQVRLPARPTFCSLIDSDLTSL